MVVTDDVSMLQDFSGAAWLPPAYYAAPKSPETSNSPVVVLRTGGGIDIGVFEATGADIYLELPLPSPPSSLLLNLNVIEHTFGLTKTELAQVLKTTRKTIYNWLAETSTPQKRNLNRIFDLVIVANDWADAGFEVDRVTLHRQVIDGSSVFGLLRDETIDRERILFAGSRLSLSQSPQPLADPFA